MVHAHTHHDSHEKPIIHCDDRTFLKESLCKKSCRVTVMRARTILEPARGRCFSFLATKKFMVVLVKAAESQGIMTTRN
jgi:hypothetical protein